MIFSNYSGRSISLLTAIACLLLTSSLLSQQIGFQSHSLVMRPKLSSPTEANDPRALALCNQALEAMGGVQKWQSVRSIKMELNLGDSAQHTLLLADDWSSDKVAYRRGLLHSHQPTASNPESQSGPEPDSSKRQMPKPDQLKTLADHLPAAALQIATSKHQYKVKMTSPDECSNTANCIDIYEQTPDGIYLREQIWEFTLTTHLPKNVRTTLSPDRTAISQTVTYVSFRTENDGMMLPAVIEVSSGHMLPQRVSVGKVMVNAPFDETNFDQELNR